MHNIHYITCAENVNRKAIMSDIERHARRDGDGYCSSFTWHDEMKPCENQQAAAKVIETLDNGWYSDHAVRFYDYSNATTTAKMKEYTAKVAELEKSKREYREKHSVHELQAKHIGCPKCGSKLNKEYIVGERCPLCRTDLRSKTTLEKLKWYDEKIADYKNRIEAEKQKQKKKAVVKWLVKYEYHS